MFCNKCGTQNGDGTKFCSNCGSSLELMHPTPKAADSPQPVYTQAPPAYAEAPQQPVYNSNGEYAPVYAPAVKKNNTKVIIIAIAAVAVVAVILALVLMLGGKGSDQDMIKGRLNTLVTAVNLKDTNQMLNCFDPASRSIMQMAISMMGGDLSSLFGESMGSAKASVTVRNIQITGDKATVDAIITIGGSSSPQTFSMVKSGGDWYIDVSQMMRGALGGLGGLGGFGGF